jgi:hypothetical protein
MKDPHPVHLRKSKEDEKELHVVKERKKSEK